MHKWIIIAAVLSFTPAFAQHKTRNLDELSLRAASASFDEFYELLSLPNVARNVSDIEANVSWCEKAFAKRSFTTQRLQTTHAPLLLAERKTKGATKTVLIYLQLDGQPVNVSQWDQEDPWKPVLKEKDSSNQWKTISYEKLKQEINREWRIFARSVADAKGPVAAFLAALDAIHELKAKPNYNIKVIMDFEEEIGSPNLPGAVAQYKEQLAADMLIIFDGPRHVSNQPTLSFGARGICEITLTTFGPRTPVHSGNYGNYTPNPAQRLAKILASMKDDDGRVTIPGFYDGVLLSQKEKDILKQVPDKEEEIRKFLGIAEPDKIGESFQESLQYPTLNIRGMDALFVGPESRTLIPATATAEIDIRLVSGSNAERLIGLVKKHVQDQGYYMVENEPTEAERMSHSRIAAFKSRISYGAFQTPFDSETGIWLGKAMVKAFGKEPIRLRTSGGSIPISPFVVTLGIPAVMVPTVNADNNQHAENENLRVGNYIDAIKTFTAILLEKL